MSCPAPAGTRSSARARRADAGRPRASGSRAPRPVARRGSDSPEWPTPPRWAARIRASWEAMIHVLAGHPRSGRLRIRSRQEGRPPENLRPVRPGIARQRPPRWVAPAPVEAGRAARHREEVAGAGASLGSPGTGRDPARDSQAALTAEAVHSPRAAEGRPIPPRRPTLRTALNARPRLGVPRGARDRLDAPGMMSPMAWTRRLAVPALATLLGVPVGAAGEERPAVVSTAATLTVLSAPVERVGAGGDQPAPVGSGTDLAVGDRVVTGPDG